MSSHHLTALDVIVFYFIFFFSSRRRHTRLQGDWSSDVCSSDLSGCATSSASRRKTRRSLPTFLHISATAARATPSAIPRSEERRVGKECRSRWSPYH